MRVIDASAIVSVGFREATADGMRRLARGQDLHAPRLLWEEVANSAWKKVRATPADTDPLLQQWRDLRDVPVTLHEVELASVLTLAIETGLTVYDACYLWLAEHLDTLVITLDERLMRVARERRRLAE